MSDEARRRAVYDHLLAQQIRQAQTDGAEDLAAELQRERLANALKGFRNKHGRGLRPYGRQPRKEVA